MYLRELRQPRSSSASFPLLTPTRRSAARLLLPTQSHPTRKRHSSLSSTSNRTDHWRQDDRAKQGSIRPFTVLALCIPVGWGLSWAFKEQSGSVATDGSPDGFVRYILENKEPISSTSAIFTLRPANLTQVLNDQYHDDVAIKSVQMKQPQLQIARNYTLLPSSLNESPDQLKFLIRKEINGEVSGYLHRLPIGAEIEVRGPHMDIVLPRNVSSVVFLAGGTGIAPAMQIADAIAGSTAVHILWANRRREDCIGGTNDTPQQSGLLSSLAGLFGLTIFGSSVEETNTESRVQNTIVKKLESQKDRAIDPQSPSRGSARMHVDYFVDEEKNFIQPKDVQRLLQSTNPSSKSSHRGDRILFVSGPEGFINYWAGPKEWYGGREVQGQLAGALSTMDLSGWTVVKL